MPGLNYYYNELTDDFTDGIADSQVSSKFDEYIGISTTGAHYLKVIDYFKLDTYAEYNNMFVDEDNNKSEGIKIQQSSNIITYDTVQQYQNVINTNSLDYYDAYQVADELVAGNNKYIYSVIGLVDETFIYDGHAHHVLTSDINITRKNYLTFNTQYNGYTFVIAASNALGKPKYDISCTDYPICATCGVQMDSVNISEHTVDNDTDGIPDVDADGNTIVEYDLTCTNPACLAVQHNVDPDSFCCGYTAQTTNPAITTCPSCKKNITLSLASSDWWYSYTTEYVDSIIAKYQAAGGDSKVDNEWKTEYEAVMKTIVLKTEYDSTVHEHYSNNITSTNINSYLSNYSKYVDISWPSIFEQVVTLKPHLFTMTIGESEPIDSSAFNSKLTKLTPPSQNPMGAPVGYNANLKYEFTTNVDGSLAVKLKIIMKLTYDLTTNSLPIITITPHDNNTSSNEGYNYNLAFYGATVDYSSEKDGSASPNTDTIYKPTGNEKIGTKSNDFDEVANPIIDSNYITKNQISTDFFGNIYTSSSKLSNYYHLPHMVTKVRLVYMHELKYIESKVTIHPHEEVYGTDYSINLYNKDGDNFFTSNKNWEYMYSVDLADWDTLNTYSNPLKPAEDKESVEKIATKNGWLIEHYFVYAFSDAYEIMMYLNDIIANASSIDTSAKAADYWSYLCTFDPSNYSNDPKFVFLSSDNKLSNQISYRELYDFIKTYYKDVTPVLNIPHPDLVNDQFVSVKVIDMMTTAIGGVNINFVDNTFAQSDLITTSIKLSQKFQRQIDTNNQILFVNFSWNANPAYVYYNSAASEIIYEGGTDTFIYNMDSSTIQDVANNNLKDASQTASKIGEQNFLLQMRKSNKGLENTYADTISSISYFSPDQFAGNSKSGSLSISLVQTNVKIRDYRINDFRVRNEYSDRAVAKYFEICGFHGACVADWIAQHIPLGPLDILTNILANAGGDDMNWDQTWAEFGVNMMDKMSSSGFGSLIKYTDPDAYENMLAEWAEGFRK